KGEADQSDRELLAEKLDGFDPWPGHVQLALEVVPAAQAEAAQHAAQYGAEIVQYRPQHRLEPADGEERSRLATVLHLTANPLVDIEATQPLGKIWLGSPDRLRLENEVHAQTEQQWPHQHIWTQPARLDRRQRERRDRLQQVAHVEIAQTVHCTSTRSSPGRRDIQRMA